MGWRNFWAEVRLPEVGTSSYRWAAIAAGHLVIGQAFASVLVLIGLSWWAIPVTLGVYWLGKEIDDLGRGGNLLDSLIDSGFVVLGAVCALEPAFSPLAIFAIAGGIGFFR